MSKPARFGAASFNQKGIATPLALLIIAVILVSGGFLFYFKFQKGTPENPNQSLQSQTKTYSKDFSFSLSDKKLLFEGGFADPSVVKLNENFFLYVNKFGQGGSANLIYSSKDGLSWTDSIKGLPGGPTARGYLTDVGIRFYYPTNTPINPTDPPSQILSAFSKDGLNFTSEEGIRIKPAANFTLEGPSVIKLADSSYRMYFSEFPKDSVRERKGARIIGASSKDGLNWTRDDQPTIQSDQIVEKSPSDWPQALRPFVLKRPAGGYIMFYNTHSKIFLAYSDNGISWQKLGGLGIKGADVDAFYLPDGTIRIYFGDFSQETSGVVYTGILKETKEKPSEVSIMDTPQGDVQPLGSKPPPPVDCVGKKATDPNLPESCLMWFKIK